MSRVHEYEGDGDVWDIMAQGRWERNSKVVWGSERGQKVLKELEAALLAMPVKKLARDIFYKEDEEVQACVLGAYAAYKGQPVKRMENLNPAIVVEDDGSTWIDDLPYDAYATAEYVAGFSNMTVTMGELLVMQNDESLHDCTPEERYERMLKFVRSKIKDDISNLKVRA